MTFFALSLACQSFLPHLSCPGEESVQQKIQIMFHITKNINLFLSEARAPGPLDPRLFACTFRLPGFGLEYLGLQ